MNGHKKGSYFILAIIVATSSCFFLLLPHIVIDDTAIILRYLDNFQKGYFFKYNISDYPVYGISGFIHGLLSGTLCYFHLASPEQAVWVSDFIGFNGLSLFIFLIYDKMTSSRPASIILWALTLTSSCSLLLVASSGLETPIHLSIILAAVYFLLIKRWNSFFFFCALMIVSKLDAAPVAGILLLYHFLMTSELETGKIVWRKNIVSFGLYFLVPLGVGLIFISLIFGTPLPQSAYAKLYFHAHPKETWFPFFDHFIASVFYKIMVIICLIFWAISAFLAFWKRDSALLLNGLFGSIFISSMALYYFYNPLEQMIWYYALPELFMIMQVLFGSYLVFKLLVKKRKPYTKLIAVLFLLVYTYEFSKKITSNFKTLILSSKLVERERMEIGQFLMEVSTPKDTLLSAHGLPSRFFKGYVIDMSGLNSKLATKYHLDPDTLVTLFRPGFIINHGYPAMEEILKKFNYKIIRVNRNITLYGYHSWVVLKRQTGDSNYRIGFMNQKLNNGKFIVENSIQHMKSFNGQISVRDTNNVENKIIHVGIDKKYERLPFRASYFKQGMTLGDTTLNILNFKKPGDSLVNVEIPIYQADSVSMQLKGKIEFEIIEPIFQLTSHNKIQN